jgi:hypothetical protein
MRAIGTHCSVSSRRCISRYSSATNKEEGISYPMADVALPERAADMAAMLANV